MPLVHPLIRLAIAQPELLAAHLGAYAALIGDEGTAAALQWRDRLAWQLLAAACACVAVALAGVAVMLVALLPLPSPASAGWLAGVPALPALVAVWALRRARPGPSAPPFDALRRNASADLAWLREASGGR